jgi:nitroreductase
MKTPDSLTALEAIATRYSCRAFTNKLPSDEDLELIAKAAVQSPSGMNRQLWRVIVVKNKALLADLEAEGMKNLAAFPDKSAYERIMSRGGKLFYNAPCMIVVSIAGAQPARAEMFDCGIVAENIALAATALGIDNLICGLAAFSFAGEKGAVCSPGANSAAKSARVSPPCAGPGASMCWTPSTTFSSSVTWSCPAALTGT